MFNGKVSLQQTTIYVIWTWTKIMDFPCKQCQPVQTLWQIWPLPPLLSPQNSIVSLCLSLKSVPTNSNPVKTLLSCHLTHFHIQSKSSYSDILDTPICLLFIWCQNPWCSQLCSQQVSRIILLSATYFGFLPILCFEMRTGKLFLKVEGKN